jgi:hypothetical protein
MNSLVNPIIVTGSTNWVKIPVSGRSPLIIQWGITGASQGTVTFPTSFTTIPSVSGNSWNGYNIQNVNAANFAYDVPSSSISTGYWVACGY